MDFNAEVERAKAELTAQHEREIAKLKSEHDIVVSKLTAEHEVALTKAGFEVTQSQAFLDLQKERDSLAQQLAVSQKEAEMLKDATKIAGDIIDVKDLVEQLINKLPTVVVSAGGGQQQQKGEQKK